MQIKSGITMSFLLVINPFLMLFYQNCSYVPSSHARAQYLNEPKFVTIESERSPASETQSGKCAPRLNQCMTQF
jgi:hypothetical protein